MATPGPSSTPPKSYPKNEPACTLFSESASVYTSLPEPESPRRKRKYPRDHLKNRPVSKDELKSWWKELVKLRSEWDPREIGSFYYCSTPDLIKGIKNDKKFSSKVANLGPLSDYNLLSEPFGLRGVFLTASRFNGDLPPLSLDGSRRIRIPINLILKTDDKDEWSLYFESAYYTSLSSRSVVDQHVRLVLVNKKTPQGANEWCKANLHPIPLDTNPLLQWRKDGKVFCANGEDVNGVYLHTIVFVVGDISWTEDRYVKSADKVESWRDKPLKVDAEWGVTTKYDPTKEVTEGIKKLQVQDTLPDDVLEVADRLRICRYLQRLEEQDIIRLVQALGLLLPDLEKMEHLLEDMVDAWLNKDGNVLATSGNSPTVQSLCKALREIDQNGIAKDIDNQVYGPLNSAPLCGPSDDSEVVKNKYMVGFQDTLKVDEFKGGIDKVEEWMKLKEHSDKGSKMLKIYGQSSVLVFRGFIAKMDKDLLGKVRKMEQVESVEKCMRFRLEAFVTEDRGAHVGWGLNRICVREKLNPESNPYWYKYLEWEDGEKGPTVYVFDSCVLPNDVLPNGEHVLNEAEAGDGIKLSGIKFRVINSTSYRTHGTSVADVVMSANGVARKKGEMVSVAVHNNIHCDEQQMLDGLEKVKEDYDQRYTTSTERSTVILNMSMSRPLKEIMPDGQKDCLTKEIEQDHKRNIVVVASAGNDGCLANTRFPGCLDTVFTVAASDIDDKLADYSNWGLGVDIIAPGTHKLRNEVMFEGTSAACAFVSGVMAKVLSHRYFKKVTPQELKDILISCSTKNVIRIPQEKRETTPNKLLFDFTQLLAELDDNHEVPFPKEKNWDNFLAKLEQKPGAPQLARELRRMRQAAAEAAATRSLDGMSDVSSCTSEESPDSSEGSPIPDDIPSNVNNWETFFPWFFLQCRISGHWCKAD